MKIKHLILSGSLLPALAACTLPGPSGKLSDWQPQRNWKQFEAAGRLAVKTKAQGSSAHFDWLRQNGVETISVNTPIGTTVGQLCQDAEGVLAVDRNGRLYRAASAEELSSELLGYPLPVQYLSVWANGEWVAAAPHRIGNDGSLYQYGWRITRHLHADGSPQTLLLENDRLTLRMVFDSSRRQSGRPERQDRCEARSQTR